MTVPSWVIFLIITSESITPSVGAACCDGTGICFWDGGTTESGWNDARTLCQNQNGDLAVIETQEMWQFIFRNEAQLGLNGSDSVWIGLTDEENENIYRWVNNAPLYYEAWKGTEPTATRQQNCVRVQNSKWYDATCSANFYALCSNVVKNCSSIVDGCIADGSNELSVKIFPDLHDARSWEDANKTCAELGLRLLTINSQQKQTEVQEVLEAANDTLWLGATDRDVESVFRWTDGSLINYVNWDDGQPTGTANSNLNCLGLSPSTMKWTDYECTDNKQFLCETIQVLCQLVPDNALIRDKQPTSCVQIPLHSPGLGMNRLFSLHVGRGCVNNNHVTLSLNVVAGDAAAACEKMMGMLATDGSTCGDVRACKILNPASAVTSGCRFSCSCRGDSGCGISFYYGMEIAEIQGLKVCEVDPVVDSNSVYVE